MPEAGDDAQWDFLTAVDCWNLYALPVVLVLVVGALVIHRRIRPAGAAGLGAVRAIQRIGLIHLVLGLRALIYLAQELQTRSTMGIFQSNPVSNLITALAVLVNPLLGVGLWRLRPAARGGAIIWYLLWSLIAGGATYWIWHYHAVVQPADWPDHVVGKAMPWFLLFVMLHPQTRHVFSRPRPLDAEPQREATASDKAPGRPRGEWPFLSRVVVVLLIVACSTLVVDALDWIHRLFAETEWGS